MSICRFSSDGWKSDVYIYYAQYGIQIEVASNKTVFDSKFPFPEFIEFDKNTYMDHLNARQIALDNSQTVAIDLPFAGSGHSFDSEEEAIVFVKELIDLGYHVPDGVIDALKEEL